MKIHIIIFAIIFSSVVNAEEYSNPGSRGVDWAEVKHKVETQEWTKNVINEMKANVKYAQDHFEYPPLGITGWFHDYFCEDDATRLTFDPQQPRKHVCPECKRVYTGSPYDECWKSSAHRVMISAIADAAVLWKITGDAQWAEYAKQQLLWYANHFDQFEVHGDHAGKGRIMSQSLDESTTLVIIMTAYWDLYEFLSPDERSTLAEKWFLQVAPFIQNQTRSIHNIHSWHNAAVGMIGFALNKDEWKQKAIDGPFGLKQQIQKGVKKDGFWYEGSISYHFYTMSSIEPLYRAAQAQGYDLSGTEAFQNMYSAPIQFTFSNGEFPANNDGWPRQNISERAPYYEYAASQWNSNLFKQVLSDIYQDQSRFSKNALLYGPVELPNDEPASRESILFEDSGIAFLRKQGTEAYLKFGPYGGGHDHHDRLNLILFGLGEVIMPDLGTSGYGIKLNQSWFRTSAAHNMLVVDGKLQKNCSGYLTDFNAKENSVHAGVSKAYDGVDIQRSLNMNEGAVIDKVLAESSEKHQYDLFYHIRGTLKENDLTFESIEPFNQKNGYDQLRNLRRLKSKGLVSLTYSMRDVNGALHLEISSNESYELIVGDCPDLPANKTMSVVILRKEGNNAQWKNQITIVE